MDIIFYKNSGFIGKAVGWQTRSKYSHVAILIDGTLYESHYKGGVQKSRLTASFLEADLYAIHTTETQTQYIKRFLEDNLGKGYDFRSVFRFITRKAAKDNNKYFCSELVAAAFQYAGIFLLHAEPHDISPRDLAMSPLIHKVL